MHRQEYVSAEILQRVACSRLILRLALGLGLPPNPGAKTMNVAHEAD